MDTIALVAMVGSLALGQELAGAVIGLMFSGGAALETVASRRARRELTALVQRAPKVAQLRVGDRLEEVSVEQVQTGDVVLVRTGEVIPVDGTLVMSATPANIARMWLSGRVKVQASMRDLLALRRLL